MSIERRINIRLMEYWVNLKGDKILPLESDIDHDDLEDIWESCFQLRLLDIITGSKYNYSFLGDGIKEAYGCDLSDVDVDKVKIISPVADKLDAQFKGVLSSRMPMETEGEFTNADEKTVAFRQCLLPFSSDGVNANSIFGGMRYRIYQ